MAVQINTSKIYRIIALIVVIASCCVSSAARASAADDHYQALEKKVLADRDSDFPSCFYLADLDNDAVLELIETSSLFREIPRIYSINQSGSIFQVQNSGLSTLVGIQKPVSIFRYDNGSTQKHIISFEQWYTNDTNVHIESEIGLSNGRVTYNELFSRKKASGQSSFYDYLVRGKPVSKVEYDSARKEYFKGYTKAFTAPVVRCDVPEMRDTKKFVKELKNAYTKYVKQTKVTLLKITSKITLILGDDKAISLKISPSSAPRKVVWASSDPTIVSVGQNGEIKGCAFGSAQVTVTSPSGKVASCKVTVKRPNPVSVGIFFSESRKLEYMLVGEEIKLHATVLPQNAEPSIKWSCHPNKILNFSSSKTDDGSVIIKATKPGMTVVYGETANGKKAGRVIEVVKGSRKEAILNAMFRPLSGSRRGASVSMAAFCADVSTDVYKFDKRALVDAGFSDITIIDGRSVYSKDIGTKASEVQTKQAMTGSMKIGDKNIVVVAFRGTDMDDPNDIITDIKAGFSNSEYHEGFYNYAAAVLGEQWRIPLRSLGKTSLGAFIEEVSNDKTLASNTKFLITGHSLGAAAAQVFAQLLLDSGVPGKCIAVYSFGSPKPYCGNGAPFKRANNAIMRIYNFHNSFDAVTKVGYVGLNPKRLGIDIVSNITGYKANVISGAETGPAIDLLHHSIINDRLRLAITSGLHE